MNTRITLLVVINELITTNNVKRPLKVQFGPMKAVVLFRSESLKVRFKEKFDVDKDVTSFMATMQIQVTRQNLTFKIFCSKN